VRNFLFLVFSFEVHQDLEWVAWSSEDKAMLVPSPGADQMMSMVKMIRRPFLVHSEPLNRAVRMDLVEAVDQLGKNCILFSV
jgi:hypothetical protein